MPARGALSHIVVRRGVSAHVLGALDRASVALFAGDAYGKSRTSRALYVLVIVLSITYVRQTVSDLVTTVTYRASRALRV